VPRRSKGDFHVEVLGPLHVRARLELGGRGQQVRAPAEVRAPVLALRQAPGLAARVAHVREAPVRDVEARAALPALVDVPGELERELRIVRGQVAAVAGRFLRPFREGEGLARAVVHQPPLRVDRGLAGELHGRLDVLRVDREVLRRDDAHLELRRVLDRVAVELRRHEPAHLLLVRGRDHVAGRDVGGAGARERRQRERERERAELHRTPPPDAAGEYQIGDVHERS